MVRIRTVRLYYIVAILFRYCIKDTYQEERTFQKRNLKPNVKLVYGIALRK